MPSRGPAHQTAARAARDSCRRLVAYLASRSGDVAAAEDALADAFHSALETWPQSGIPQNPEAWLLTSARRRLIDGYRHAAVQAAAQTTLLALADEVLETDGDAATFPDERLKLMFICAHPAIDPAVRTPLMLQVVLDLDAQDIASAFLVKPAAMGQRLTRAKNKIRDAGISYEVPQSKALADRLDAVLQAIYGAYGIGWDDTAGAAPLRRGLSLEAIELGYLLTRLMPGQPEAMGLLALMLHCEARCPARRNAKGEYVPLDAQDVGLWRHPLIEEADGLLQRAASMNRPGRFQLEAAIQSVHSRRAVTGQTDWPSIAMLYEGLANVTPSLGVMVARAAATAKACSPQSALELLVQLPSASLAAYQPYWALVAQLYRALGRNEEAADAFQRAIGLCADPATRQFLLEQSSQSRVITSSFHGSNEPHPHPRSSKTP